MPVENGGGTRRGVDQKAGARVDGKRCVRAVWVQGGRRRPTGAPTAHGVMFLEVHFALQILHVSALWFLYACVLPDGPETYQTL